MSTVQQQLLADTASLQQAGCESARLDTELLLTHILGVERAWLYAHASDTLDQQTQLAMQALIQRRAQGEPLAHIVGCKEFWSLMLTVDSRVLSPRPETECLVEAVLDLALPDDCHFLDAGTGSGAIALALLSERVRWHGIALDIDADALAVCKINVQRHACDDRLQLQQGVWLQAIAANSLHLIVSNPPYIPRSDKHLNAPELGYEPLHALASGDDGMDAIRTIASQAPTRLVPHGFLAVEHGYDQQAAVIAVFESEGLEIVEAGSDLAGQPRYVVGKKAAS